jgi:hypothetical protein
MWASKGDGANRRPSGQTDGSDTLSATVAVHRAFPVAGRLVQLPPRWQPGDSGEFACACCSRRVRESSPHSLGENWMVNLA